ncbi:hypothetical protein D3C77_710690 [compost metagenome]
MSAGWSIATMLSHVRESGWKPGNPRGIAPYAEPIVVTLSGNNMAANRVDIMIPTREAGTLGRNLGVKIRAARQMQAVRTL